jgi:hypothetical protein
MFKGDFFCKVACLYENWGNKLSRILGIYYLLVSVRLWNFKDGGSLNAKFLAKNQHTQRNLFKKNPLMNYGSSKSAKIVLSNSISMSKINQI